MVVPTSGMYWLFKSLKVLRVMTNTKKVQKLVATQEFLKLQNNKRLLSRIVRRDEIFQMFHLVGLIHESLKLLHLSSD